MKRKWVYVVMLLVALLIAGITPGASTAKPLSYLGESIPEPFQESADIHFQSMDSLSPDGSRLVFVTASNLGMRDSKIWISDVTGTNKWLLTEGTNDFWITNPIWSPDGDRIAYLRIINVLDDSRGVDSKVEIWIVNVTDRKSRQILDSTNFHPTLGYGGKTNISWISRDELEWFDHKSFPATRYRINIETGDLQAINSTIQPLQILAQPSDVPCFSQHDSRWACDQLGYNSAWTMGDCASKPGTSFGGCAVTSVAMALKYFGIDTDPGRLNQWLKDNGGFSGAAIIWATVANIDSSISFSRVDSEDWNRLKAELDAGYPVILQVTGTNGSHYVLATGYNDNTFYINDTGTPCARTLDVYNNRFINMKIYHGNLPPSDRVPPIITFNTPAANRWYNTDRTLSWSITDDKSGVDYFKWAWDTSPYTQVNAASGSTTLSAIGQGQHTLYVQAWDVAGNPSTVASAGPFGYDTTVPTVTFLINNGAITTEQTTVALDLTYGDTGSGVSEARASNNGLTWSDWTPIAAALPWAIPALDLTTLPVYVQVRDGAGNLSAVVSDTITLDLYPPAPHSANYRMCSAVINTGGSAGITSTGYSLVSSIGQAWNSGASGYTSTAFTAGAGFLADVDGCRAITRPAPRGFDIPQWVVASGGNTRSSAGYRLGDTTGEALVSGAQPMQSAGYQLSGGFWGQIASTTATCPVPLVGVGIRGPLNLTETIFIGTNYLFAAILTPTNATPPITYTWSPTPQSGQGTATATYQWATAGSKTITATAQNCGGVITVTRTVNVPPPVCPAPLTGARLTGPTTGDTGSPLTFTAILTPVNATPPITYTWTPPPLSGQGTPTATYQWDTAGVKTVRATAQNCGGIVTATRMVSITAPPPVCPTPLTGVRLTGPTTGETGADLIFTAILTPANATPPITYTWSPAPQSGQGTATATYQWATAGSKTIALSVQNCGGTRTAQRTLTVVVPTPAHTVYLPLVLRSRP